MNLKLVENLSIIIHRESSKTARLEWIDAQKPSDPPIHNYRYEHVEQVVRISDFIAKEVDADQEVVTIAAWLHDTAKPGLGGEDSHGFKGAERARTILLEEGVDVEVIDRVCDVIEKHVGLTREKELKPIEAQVLWEADKIVKLGITGLIHFLLNGLRIKPGRDLQEISSAIQEFLSLAEKIAHSMFTAPGRELAETRLETLRLVSAQLGRELSLD